MSRSSEGNESNQQSSHSEEPVDKPLVAWLFLCSGLVFCIVVVGGLTRLTESGLSMVDWSLLHYKPPQSLEAWVAYFEQYKNSPEYLLLNQGMSLDEFKKIYYMEYGHRMLGRLLGAVYFFPMIYFLVTRRFTTRQKATLAAVATLILGQV
jgi:heme a synthase